VTYFPAASITRASFGTFTDVRGPIAEIRRSTTRIVASGWPPLPSMTVAPTIAVAEIRRLAGVQDESVRQEQR
jgi:hypothetical protein